MSPHELGQSVLLLLKEWLPPLVDNPDLMATCGYQSHIVLALCRILYTLNFGAVVSKQETAQWVLIAHGEHRGRIVKRAWEGRHFCDAKPVESDLKGTLELIRFAQSAADIFR